MTDIFRLHCSRIKVNDILIGTSGYDHPELKGSFYPSALPRKDFLQYFSSKFNALELNTTFYGMPTPERMNSFYERTEGRIKLSVKMNRLLTHEINLDWKNSANDFRNALIPLAEKNALGAVLIQFPESFGYSVENRYYLASLLSEFKDFNCVVEFRHRDWIHESVFEGLEKRNAGIVFCDMPQLKNLPDGFASKTPFIGKTAYIRLHGRNEAGWYAFAPNNRVTTRYDYEYSLDELKAFLPVIKTACEEGRVVHMYFNNHPKGCGFKNALEMQQLVMNNF